MASGSTTQLALTLISLVLAPLASAVHVTDGIFSPTEWTGPNVNKKFFAPGPGGSGNAWLYVEQEASILYLGYDNVANTTPPNASTFSDVFFQVPSEQEDYAIRIHGNNTFDVFVKPFGPPSQIAADGSFDLTKPPWSPADPADLQRANFRGAIGFGVTPNTPLRQPATPHVFVEFQLDINNTLGGRQPPTPGLYDPSPAFWSASTGGSPSAIVGPGAAAAHNPAITSAIFTLNADLTTIVTPVLGNDGGPVLQIPEVPSPPAVAQTDGVYQLRYLANLDKGDSYVNLTNAGTLDGRAPAGNICVNVYTFDPAEELISCCACPITPNGLVSLSARNDLISNTLTPGVPTSITVKLLSSAVFGTVGGVAGTNISATACNAAGPGTGVVGPPPVGNVFARGMRAWATTLHLNTSIPPVPGMYQKTETPFSVVELSPSELLKLTSFCGFIQANGSGFGICKVCRFGALAGEQK